MLPKLNNISFKEFLDIDNNSDEYLEYIDGQVYNQASPSTLHQKVSVNFTVEFRNYFKHKECEIKKTRGRVNKQSNTRYNGYM